MLTVFINALPFFLLIGLGFVVARVGGFSQQATAHLTQFIYFYPLSAMIFNFSSKLSLGDIFDWRFASAYVLGSAALYLATIAFQLVRKQGFTTALIDGHCSIIGNTGWMGLAMIPILLGPEAVPYAILVLMLDLVVFYPITTMLIVAKQQGEFRLAVGGKVLLGLFKNPMVLSVAVGLIFSTFQLQPPKPVDDFLALLGAASTPGALFAIGASMVYAARDSLGATSVVSMNKLLVHPVVVGLLGYYGLGLGTFEAAVMGCCAALPVAGNIYMMASHYNVHANRVSFTILISTVASIITLPLAVTLALSL